MSTKLKRWRFLHCKFDKVNPRPLSFIISGFDRYFAKLLKSEPRRDSAMSCDDNSDDELREIRRRIRDSFKNENLTIICHFIPNVKLVLPEDERPSNEAFGGDFDSSDFEASKCRLHHLFGLLLKAISEKPVLMFLDDQHWADQASLDLIMALVQQQANEVSNVLFVGSYRSNEVADTDPVSVTLRQIKGLSNVNFTDIPLGGLSCDDVNVMVSEALCYPQRLTRPLSSLIHQKSTGNPLFVKGEWQL